MVTSIWLRSLLRGLEFDKLEFGIKFDMGFCIEFDMGFWYCV